MTADCSYSVSAGAEDNTSSAGGIPKASVPPQSSRKWVRLKSARLPTKCKVMQMVGCFLLIQLEYIASIEASHEFDIVRLLVELQVDSMVNVEGWVGMAVEHVLSEEEVFLGLATSISGPCFRRVAASSAKRRKTVKDFEALAST